MKIINLIPPDELSALRKSRVFHIARNFVVASVITYVIAVVALVGGRLYEQQNYLNLDNQIKEQQQAINAGDNVVLQKQITDFNKTVTDYDTLVESNPRWSYVLENFVKLVPVGVDITGLSANSSTGKIEIKGVGDVRDNVLILRSNIVASKLFRDIDLPLDNLQDPVNSKFHYSFYLRDGVLSPSWKPTPIEVEKPKTTKE